jgi:nicotinate phosphoribosyltransferase
MKNKVIVYGAGLAGCEAAWQAAERGVLVQLYEMKPLKYTPALNHQSLIATKASRMVRAAAGRPISEFGARRAHGSAAAMLGARAAYIGGCAATSCTIADLRYGVPATGTMAHSWVQMFDDEYTAFKTYCEIYPQDAVLLIDTYNVLESGLPNAIRAFREVLLPRGITKCGVRLDSGDIAYLRTGARRRWQPASREPAPTVLSLPIREMATLPP